MITVLGASGFIGSHLLKRLDEQGTDFFAPRREEKLTGRNLGDVVYCIGLTSDFRSQPFTTVEAHVCKLLDVLQDCEFDSLLYLSSARVYAPESKVAYEEDAMQVSPLDPDHLYNISKAMGESLALSCGKRVRVARISNVFGDDFTSQNFLSSIIKDAIKLKIVTLRTSLNSAKDYVSIDDVVDGLIKIATRGQHRIYNLASGRNVSHGQLMEKIVELTGCRVEEIPRAPRITYPQISIDRMRAEFGFQPSSVLDSMSELVEIYERRYGGLGD